MKKDAPLSLERRREIARAGIEMPQPTPAPRRWLQALPLLALGTVLSVAGVMTRGTKWASTATMGGAVFLALGVLVLGWALFEWRQRKRWEATGEALDPSGDGGDSSPRSGGSSPGS